MSDLKVKTKEWILSVCIIIAYFALSAVILIMGARQFTMFNGVYMSLQYGLCLLLIYINRKHGTVIATVLLSVSLAVIIRALFISEVIAVLPGLCNSVFYFITAIILGRFYQKREKENISDMLTGLLNRRGLYKHLKEKVGNDEKFSLVYLSIDNFKFINDTYGHAYGDELLRRISIIMKEYVGQKNEIARIGGAEYVVVLENRLNARETADKLLDVVRQKISIDIDNVATDCYLTCYAGVSTYSKDAKDYEELIKHADIAMYEALSHKSKTAYVFDDNMAEYINKQMVIENKIKEALLNDLFYLVYQPQYDLKTRKMRGVEALIRMKNSGDEKLGPGEFIPVAEKSDLILQIDDYVLRQAMTEFKPIVEQNKDLMLSINVSAKNIGSVDFSDKVAKVLAKTGFSAKNLEIEITEYCMVESMETTIDNINKLKAMDIEIALDDFGTGYTSLNYVAKLPIDLLKIDKSLIDDIVANEKGRRFVHTVVSLGHLMECKVISEGVEDETQVSYLKEDGCDFVQGFVWSRPLGLGDLMKLLNE